MIKLRTPTKPTSGRMGRSSGNSRFLLSTGLAVLAAVGVADVARSQTWTGAVDTDFGTAGNWDNFAVPGAGDDVVLDNGLSFNAIGAFAADSLTINSGIGSIAGGSSITVTTGIASVLVSNPSNNVNATLTIDGGLVATTVTANRAATINVNGALVGGTVILTDDATINVGTAGAITGNIGVTGSSNLNIVGAGVATGAVTGDLNIDGSASTTFIGGNRTITGNISMNRGSLIVGGDVTGTLTAALGTNFITVSATGTVAGLTNVSSTSGTTNVQVNGALNGGLTSGARSSVNVAATGSVTGPLIVNGGDITFEAGSSVVGNVTLNSGILDFGSTTTVTGDVAVNGGTLTGGGILDGSLTLAAGTVYNAGGLSQLVGHNTINNGTVNVDTGNFNTAGNFTNNNRLTISNGQNLIATGAGGFTNNGVLELGNGVSGSIAATVTASVIGVAGSEIRLRNQATGDNLTISSNLTGTSTIYVDGSLNVPGAGTIDTVTVGGTLDGDLTIRVRPVIADYALQNDLIVVNANNLGGALTTSLEGIPRNSTNSQTSESLVLYSLQQSGGNIVLRSELNPAVGGVASAISSVSSLIGTVINRPSGAFVSGIAFDTPNNCSTGSWARMTGGRMAADTQTSNNNGSTITASGITEFLGIQGGVDFGCFEAFDGGWDVSGGLLFGANKGWFSQYAGSGVPTRGDFDQTFVGAYIAASTGNWSGEMQIRHEDGNMSFTNSPLSLRGSEVDSKSLSVSGSVTYRYALENSWSLLPTVGFAVSRSEVSALTFTNAVGTAIGQMRLEDHTNKTAFIAATLSKTVVDVANASASSHFLTATYYQDHSGNRSSTFTPTGSPITATLNTGEIGDFGEISIGTAFVKVLGANTGGARQFNASIRGDHRFGNDVDGTSVTAQIRLQF